MAYYQINTASNGQHYFNLYDNNHEKILTSELYYTKGGAELGIDSCKRNSGNPYRYTDYIGQDGKYWFSLEAANGEKIGKSEGYNTSSARNQGRENCIKEGPTATTS